MDRNKHLFKRGFSNLWITPTSDQILDQQQDLRRVLDRICPLVHELWLHNWSVQALRDADAELTLAGASLQKPVVRVYRITLSRPKPYWIDRQLIGHAAKVALLEFAPQEVEQLLDEAIAIDRRIRHLAGC
jgi:hypothetical protein